MMGSNRIETIKVSMLFSFSLYIYILLFSSLTCRASDEDALGGHHRVECGRRREGSRREWERAKEEEENEE